MSFDQKLTAFLNRSMDEYRIPGLDLCVFHEHKEVFRYKAGYRDLENKLPITENTLYNIYSNTKVITCVAAMQLYEQGYFLLEDPLSRFFPEFENMRVRMPDGRIENAKNPITIRDLFRMTAGFGDGNDYQEMGMKFYTETGGACPLIELPKYLAKMPLLFEPGTKYLYGISHEMLAALIVRITGKSFSEYLRENIFLPLGMKNTAFTLEECSSKDLANQYVFSGSELAPENKGPANFLIPPILKESASGGLISSVDDYMAFQEALCRENVLLHKRTTDLMRLDQLKGSMREGYGYTNLGMGYGLGVRTVINQAECGAPVGFGPYGWGGAAGTYGSIDPENKLTIFYAQSYFGPNDLRLHHSLRNVIYTCRF